MVKRRYIKVAVGGIGRPPPHLFSLPLTFRGGEKKGWKRHRGLFD